VTNLGAVIIAAAMALGGKGDALQWVWDKLLEIWPIGSMDQWQRGIRLRFGRPVRRWGFGERETLIVQPGAYLKLPFMHRVIEVNVASRTESVTPVPVTTKDNVSVKLGMNLRFRVVDVAKWQLEVHNPVQSILNEGESVLADFGSRINWNVVWSVKSVNAKLTKEMQARCSKWGAEVEAAELNCFVEAKGYQVFGDPGSAPLFNEDDE
jgi:regulator of protease activity HflC (stomatin/prohibitin superfamily)